jgi:hypothetical protein
MGEVVNDGAVERRAARVRAGSAGELTEGR